MHATAECTGQPTLNNGATFAEADCQTSPVSGLPATTCNVKCPAGMDPQPAKATCTGTMWDTMDVDCIGRLRGVHAGG